MVERKDQLEKNWLIIVFLAAFLIRVVFSFLPGLSVDINVWYAWAQRLVNLGLARFYDPQVWSNYTPGYLYVLYLLEKLRSSLSLNPQLTLQLFKLPANLADLVGGYFVYKIIRPKSQKLALFSSAFYLFNPALLFNSAVWGQIDSLIASLLLASFYLLREKKKLLLSMGLVSVAFLVKPQALFALPVLLFFLFKYYPKLKTIQSLLIFGLLCLLLSLPFFPQQPFLGLPSLIIQMANDYPYTTLNAFNFWQLMGNWQPDGSLFLGISKQLWGLEGFLLLQLTILAKLFVTPRKDKASFYLAVFLSLFAFFLFLTRIHERYLLPSLIFLLISAGLLKSLALYLSYIFLSLIHFFNLYYVYCNYQQSLLKIDFLYQVISRNLFLFSLLSVILFFFLLTFFLSSKTRVFLKKQLFFLKNSLADLRVEKTLMEKKKKSKISAKKERFKQAPFFLILILSFAFLTRIVNLWYPQAYIFDEVYHAFTAQEMVAGNKAAWEWWNTPPKGFAYEWTHPPVAKLIMAGGITLGRSLGINNDFFSWRLPAALFGVGVVYLVYLLSRRFFKSEKLALVAAFLMSLEGLTLVMSRIGMSDIYFLFFILLSLWLALEKKWLLVGLIWGLAVATKWTGVYLSLPLFILFAWQNKAKPTAFYRWFLIILLPVLVYLFSYSLFFTSGHTFKQFKELQQQMWGYHTGLKATHNYQSKPYTWPLDLRPVWFFVNYQRESVGHIYALGNPIIFWLGLVSLPIFIYETFLKRSKRFLFVLLLYFIFWAPWIFSPRIMFLYHYLPSVPFLVMILAWLVGYLDKVFGKKNLVLVGFLLLISVSFFFFYPLWTGIVLPKDWLSFFFWLPTWR